jgi:hypothetical protein
MSSTFLALKITTKSGHPKESEGSGRKVALRE